MRIALFALSLAVAMPLRLSAAPEAKPATLPAARPHSTFTDRAKAENKNPHGRGRVTPAEAKANLAAAAKIDKAIGDYLKTHEVPPAQADRMWEGRPGVGMALEQLRTFGDVTIRSETADSATAAFIVPDFQLHTAEETPIYRLVITDGKVAEIENPR